jgi:hypothetical protein
MANAAAILVEDFQDVDAGQFELLRAVAPPAGKVAVSVFGDPMGSMFARRGTQHRYLMREFPSLYGGETFHLAARTREGGLPPATLEALLAETIGEEGGRFLPVVVDRGAEAAGGDGGASGAPCSGSGFRVEKVRDEVEEVYAVAARTAGLLRTRAHRAEDIAIITNEKQRYQPRLVAAATQRGIPLETGRTKKGVFGDFVDALLALIESPGNDIASRAVLTSPLLRYLSADSGANGAGTPPDPRKPPESGDGGNAPPGNPLSFVDDVRSEIRSSDAGRWMRIITERCLRPIAVGVSKESGDERFFQDISRYLEWWDRYVDGVGASRGRASVGEFAAFDSILSRRRATGAAGSVTYLSCREAKGRYFPAVFVIGCSELVFPSALRSESVLPVNALEKALQLLTDNPALELYPARSAARRLSEEHHLLYVALTRSQAYLHVTAPQTFAGEEYPAPSSVLERTVPGDAYIERDVDFETPPQLRVAAACCAGATYEAGTRLESLSPAGSHWSSPVDPARSVPVVPFPLSQSSLETYLKCARRFFYQKVLRIPREDSPAATVGLILHRVMAALGERFSTRAALLSGATDELVRRIIDEELRKEERVARASFYERALRRRLETAVRTLIDIERSDGEDRAIRGVERQLDFSNGPWRFTGRIDRLDESRSGETFIVDYKTGKFDKMGKTLRRKTLQALEDPAEANWQVPIYAWGVRATTDRLPRAFTHLVATAGVKPFAVTLFMGKGESDIPQPALKQASYLLEAEIKAIMERASEIAAEIFSPRDRFEKTEDRGECRYCDFKRLCQREER